MTDEQDEVRGLLAKLRDYRTRSGAADELAAMGGAAVPALVEALRGEAHEGARWAIINCLGEIGSEAAVAALAPFLEDGDYETVAHEALVRIVGRDLGPMPPEWLRWAQCRTPDAAGAGGAPALSAQSLTSDRLLDLALDDGVATWRMDEEDRFTVELPLAGACIQRVAVVFGQQDHEGAEIVVVYADIGEARPEHYETVLRRNLRLPYGAVALRDVAGRPHFVMFNTILRHALSPVELRKSITTIGELADRLRRQLSN